MAEDKDTKVVAPKEETVKVSKSSWENMLARLDKIENKDKIKIPKRIKEHFAFMREHDGELVVGFGQPYQGPMTNGEPKTLWDVELKNGKTKPVPYLDFLNNADKVQVKILKQTAVEREAVDTRDGGGGISNKYDQATDKVLSDQVELVVTYVDYEIEVEVEEGNHKGEVLKVSPKSLNI